MRQFIVVCIYLNSVLFNFLYYIIYEIKSLEKFILCYIYYNESFQIYCNM